MDTYISTNTKNGKFYIGSTTDFEWRKYCHLNSKANYPFQNALRKNPEGFLWEVFSDDSDEPVLEQALLDKFFGTGQCYNLNPTAGRPPSQRGRPVSEETRKKQSEARTGTKRSKETKRKMRASAKRGEKHPWFGQPPTSPAAQRGENNPLNKAVEVVYPDGTVRVFCSTKEAGELLGVSGPSVAEAAREGKTKTRGNLKGYTFRYL
jgi:group I intron endonuclease